MILHKFKIQMKIDIFRHFFGTEIPITYSNKFIQIFFYVQICNDLLNTSCSGTRLGGEDITAPKSQLNRQKLKVDELFLSR